MAQVFLKLSNHTYRRVWSHLLSADAEPSESAAFLFVKPTSEGDAQIFEYADWHPVLPDEYQIRTDYHIELTDQTRATVIKRAHDLDASVVEFHSHIGPGPAAFSFSDLFGFGEFVPHVWWRLKGKPYFAVVVTQSDFDGLVWIDDPRTSRHLDGIVVGEETLKPTRLSSYRWSGHE